MINFNPNINGVQGGGLNRPVGSGKADDGAGGKFENTIKDAAEKVNEMQTNADDSVKDLLAGKTDDINSVVASVAKADMSFKALVGVRNKIIEAYKETMRMQI